MKHSSPNEVYSAAKEAMLNGFNPVTKRDWVKVFSFFAVNIHSEVQPVALHLMKAMYSADITEEEIDQICLFYKERKKK